MPGFRCCRLILLKGIEMGTMTFAKGLVAGLAATIVFSADTVLAQTKPTRPGTSGQEFLISCFRGPWLETVAWDRPNAVFVDELMEYGYSPGQAIAIGKRVCRDEFGVGDHEYMKATLNKLITEHPPVGRRKN